MKQLWWLFWHDHVARGLMLKSAGGFAVAALMLIWMLSGWSPT